MAKQAKTKEPAEKPAKAAKPAATPGLQVNPPAEKPPETGAPANPLPPPNDEPVTKVRDRRGEDKPEAPKRDLARVIDPKELWMLRKAVNQEPQFSETVKVLSRKYLADPAEIRALAE